MAGKIGWMGWRSFRKRLRKKVVPISVEAALHCQRVKNIVVKSGIDRAAITRQNLAQDGATGLGTLTKVDIPLLVPDVVYGEASDSRDRRRKVGSTKGAKAILRPRADVRIARVHGGTDGAKHHVSREVSLIEYVQMGIGAQTAPVMNVARLWIQLVPQPIVDPIFDLLESSRVSHVIHTRRVGNHLLAHSLCTEEGGDKIKLRDVRPHGIAVVRPTEEQIWRDAPMVISRPCVGRHS